MTKLLQASKEDIISCVEKASADYKVAALTKKDGKTLFDFIKSGKDILWDYTPTVLSPKKFFFPQKETLIDYEAGKQIKTEHNREAMILFGIRPCDTNAIAIMYEAFAEYKGDPNYLEKANRSIVVCMDCKEVCDEDAFCCKVTSNYAETGFDIMLKPNDDSYCVVAKTEKGKKFAETYLDASEGDPEKLNQFEKEKKEAFEGHEPFKHLENFPAIFNDNKDHKIWAEEAKRCLNCGSCIMVCPTCYCFDVDDEVSLDLKNIRRVRNWDACMLEGFASVATGENFRQKAESRLRHRINRKYNFLMEKHHRPVCVGCGRCVRACLAEISPKTIAEAILEDIKAVNDVEYKSEIEVLKPDPSIFLPEEVVIKKTIDFTSLEKFFELELKSGRSLGHDPGQFIQVFIPGIGEAPISISSPTTNDNKFDICVRAVGDVTKKLHTLKEGDRFYIRGPLGHGFDEAIRDELKGKDLLFFLGGIGYVPARSLIKQVLDSKDDYGKISILYGCKSPEERMYPDELRDISLMGGNVKLLETVDKPDDQWIGHKGVITTLTPKVDINPDKTKVIVVGPPIMYKFVLLQLLDLNVKAEDIYMSLERRMRCGVGKCGHCQMEGFYVCRQGPVFRYSDVMFNKEVL